MTHKPPEVRYDPEMPPEAQERFMAFMETLNEHPDIVQGILDTYADDEALIAAATEADETSIEGKALVRFGNVLAHNDQDSVEPDDAFHAKINTIFDRAEQYNNRIDRRRAWYSVLVQEALLARGAGTATPTAQAKQVTVGATPPETQERQTAKPVTAETEPESVKPASTKPAENLSTPDDEKPVTIPLIAANRAYRRPIAKVIFMAPEYSDQE